MGNESWTAGSRFRPDMRSLRDLEELRFRAALSLHSVLGVVTRQPEKLSFNTHQFSRDTAMSRNPIRTGVGSSLPPPSAIQKSTQESEFRTEA
jgi:hypothetical protein